ncbi:MAG: hypothetical protein JKY84_10860 [Emcibacteraceae bacterium]|nr:hypothetical protein [Emcibacteraceae bacterium]
MIPINLDLLGKLYYTGFMYTRMVYLVMVSFLFAQVTCAMSESAEIFLEAAEHSEGSSISHDTTSEQHDELTEHQDQLTGVSHCVHSHPPMTFLFSDSAFGIKTSEAYFTHTDVQELISIVHRPPISPPKA